MGYYADTWHRHRHRQSHIWDTVTSQGGFPASQCHRTIAGWWSKVLSQKMSSCNDPKILGTIAKILGSRNFYSSFNFIIIIHLINLVYSIIDSRSNASTHNLNLIDCVFLSRLVSIPLLHLSSWLEMICQLVPSSAYYLCSASAVVVPKMARAGISSPTRRTGSHITTQG